MNLQAAGGSPSLNWPGAITRSECPQPRLRWARGLKFSVPYTQAPWKLPYPLLPMLHTHTSHHHIMELPRNLPPKMAPEGLTQIIHVIDVAEVTQLREVGGTEKGHLGILIVIYNPFSHRKFLHEDYAPRHCRSEDLCFRVNRLLGLPCAWSCFGNMVYEREYITSSK